MTTTTARFFADLGRVATIRCSPRRAARCASTWPTATRSRRGCSSSTAVTSQCRGTRSSRPVGFVDAKLFDGVATGQVNAMAGMSAAELVAEGDPHLLMLFQRTLPGPTGSRCLRPDDRREDKEMSEGLVKILEGNTFVVSDDRGDIEASLTDPTGSVLVRHAFHLEVGPEHQRRAAERALDRRPPVLRSALLPRSRDRNRLHRLPSCRLSANARSATGSSSTLTILNHDATPVELSVRLDVGCDFADLFEVKDALEKKGKYYTKVDAGSLLLGYERETFRRETMVTTATQAAIDDGGVTFAVTIEPHGEWSAELEVEPLMGGAGLRVRTSASGRGGSQHGTRSRAVARRRTEARV